MSPYQLKLKRMPIVYSKYHISYITKFKIKFFEGKSFAAFFTVCAYINLSKHYQKN